MVDFTSELVKEIRSGQVVALVVPKSESFDEARRVFARVERDYNLKLGHMPYVSATTMGFLVWLEGAATPPLRGA